MKKKITKIFFGILTLIICSIAIANINKINRLQQKTDENINFQISSGNSYITNFELNNINDKQIWSICQDSDGLMLFANRRSILCFDGDNWGYIKTPSTPYKLYLHKATNTIFVGNNDGIGYLEKNNGSYIFVSLPVKDMKNEAIVDIQSTEEDIYFYTEKSIIRVNASNYQDNSVITNKNSSFKGIFNFKKDIYAHTSEGFFKIAKTSIANIVYFKPEIDFQILFTLPIDDANILIGASNDMLYKFNGNELTEFETEAKNYFLKNFLITANNINGSLCAISTINGGTIIINLRNGNIENVINYSAGLPDNEIYSSFYDSNGGLWLSHIAGLSRVDINLPVKNYSNYYGLKGNIVSTSLLDSMLYVITTDGVFYLTRPKNQTEIIEIIKKQEEDKKDKKNNTQNAQNNQTINIDENTKNEDVKTDDSKTEEKKNIFQKWKEKRKDKKNKKDKDEEDENTTDTEVTEENTTEVPETIVEPTEEKNSPQDKVIIIDKKDTQTNFEVNFYYKKIEGIDAKTREIIKYDNSLIVTTNSGLYQINNNKAEPIIKQEFIYNICKSLNNKIIYAITENGLYILQKESNKWKILNKIEHSLLEEVSFSLVEDNQNNLWLGQEDMALHIKLKNNDLDTIITHYFDTDFSDKVIVKNIDNKILFVLPGGLFSLNETTQKIEILNQVSEQEINSTKYINSENSVMWFYKENKWNSLANSNLIQDNVLNYLNLFDNISNIKTDDNKDIWLVNNYNSIYKIKSDTAADYFNPDFKLLIKSIKIDSIYITDLENIVLDYNQNNLSINVFAPYFLKDNSNRYQYMIEGLMNQWSEWTDNQNINLYLKSGQYTLYIRAKNIFNETTTDTKINIRIKYPFWQTIGFYIFISLLLIGIVIMFFKMRQQALVKRNQILEDKVRERTHEIEMQKEELRHQKDEIEKQRDLVTSQRDQISYQNKQITDSIEYASRIQVAVLPLDEVLTRFFDQYFIINMPRDVVSGDFYFFREIEDKIIVAVADCTGHGVPGAFLSMLGLAYLNEIVANYNVFYANEILNALRKQVIAALRQSEHSDRKDGMDISLCLFDTGKQEVQFAGAYNPLIMIRNNEVIEINADKMPIGFHRRHNNNFSSQILPYLNNDIFYMFSDGYIDQFGGAHGRKFLKANFRNLLLEISPLSMDKQREAILQNFYTWKGEHHQIDDIMVLGIKT